MLVMLTGPDGGYVAAVENVSAVEIMRDNVKHPFVSISTHDGRTHAMPMHGTVYVTDNACTKSLAVLGVPQKTVSKEDLLEPYYATDAEDG